MPKNKTLALNSGIQTNQILTNDDEGCLPSLSSILLAVFKHIGVRLYYGVSTLIFMLLLFHQMFSISFDSNYGQDKKFIT